MAECHPVGFQWVMEAKARGAVIIHIDPRFTRTSAVADLHVPIRAGSDIAFLGGLIRHVLENDLWFHDYVQAYTNASTILHEDFQDTEELDGVFSGLREDGNSYDASSWEYEGMQAAAASGASVGETSLAGNPGWAGSGGEAAAGARGSLRESTSATRPTSAANAATFARRRRMEIPRRELHGEHTPPGPGETRNDRVRARPVAAPPPARPG